MIDRYGNKVIGPVDSVYFEHNHVFQVKVGDNYGLIHADGTEILSCVESDTLMYKENGICKVSYDDTEEERLVMLDGTNSLLDLPYDLYGAKDGKAFVVKDKGYTLQIGNDDVSFLAYGLCGFRNTETRKRGVYDAFTGNILLPATYSVVDLAGDYLYAYEMGVWTVFEISGPVQ